MSAELGEKVSSSAAGVVRRQRDGAGLSSITLTCLLIAVLALLCLAGAWVPQSTVTDDAELLEKFGTQGSALLKAIGLTDVFRSPLFLGVVLLLFVNLAVCTITRLAPRIRARISSAPCLEQPAIEKLPLWRSVVAAVPAGELEEHLSRLLRQRGYSPRTAGGGLIFERGRAGVLAGPVTHAGLFILIIGVCVTALTSYRGMLNLSPGESKSLTSGGTARPLFGSMPAWKVCLDSTRREVHPGGQPRQWYSAVRVVDGRDNLLGAGTISVNNPLTVRDVDLYQSDWRLSSVRLILNGTAHDIPIREMGGDYMAVIPLLPDLALIVAVSDESAPLRLYIKRDEAPIPVLFGRLAKGQTLRMGRLTLGYEGATARTGLQFKRDPGLPLAYAAFGLLMLGALLVAVPYRQLRAQIVELGPNRSRLIIGCLPSKLRGSAERELVDLEAQLHNRYSGEVLVREY